MLTATHDTVPTRLRAICLTVIVMLLLTAQVNAAPLNQSVTPLTLPPGFRDTRVVGGLLSPRDFTFLPDNRILATEWGKAGSDDQSFASIRVVQNGVLLPDRAWSVRLCASGEQGLLGIATDPAFASNGYIYIYYTAFFPGSANPCVNQISRLTMNGNTLGNEKVLVTNIFNESDLHSAGGLRFDAAGYLYATTGNGGNASLSGRNDTLEGRVLRIRPDASLRGYNTTGNPYDATGRYCGTTPPQAGTQPCREILAYGLRNPYRFAVQPNIPGVAGTNSIWLGDVGDGAAEEINNVTLAGGDFGYPTCEGPCTPPIPGKIQPIYWYPHQQGVGAAVIAGDFYTGNSYPVEYRNNFFFLDFVSAWIQRLAYNPTSGQWEHVDGNFATGAQSTVINLKAGPNGNLYYLVQPQVGNQTRTAEIRMIEYGASNNTPPEARISAPVLNCPLNTSCQISAIGTFDPDGDAITNYNWRVRYVGDATDTFTANTTTPVWSYSFNQNRNANVTLIATDSRGGESDSVFLTLYPGNQAATGTLTIQNLTDDTRGDQLQYFNGDEWRFEITNASDQDGTLPANPVFWIVVFHHNDHSHPFISHVTAPSVSFTIDRLYHKDHLVWYRIYAYITDGRGQVTAIQRDINPIKVNVSFAASLPNVQFVLDSVPQSLPNTTTFVVGTELQMVAPPAATYQGFTYNFTSWADGPTTATRNLVIGPSPITYTATYGSPTTAAPIRNRYTTPTPTLTWLPISSAVGYEVQLSSSSTFSALITIPNNPFPGTANSFPTPSLTPGIYYWRVRAQQAGGAVSAWSGVETFAIVPP